jgi:DNA-directed RNA polymerase specialized sigma subunit
MEKFLKQIEPVIKSKIRKYRPHIKNADYHDLMQEGYLAALIAANRWKIGLDKAGLMAWTMIHIEFRFKELAMKSTDTVSMEEINVEISQEQANTAWGTSRDLGKQAEAREKITRSLINSVPNYKEFLERSLDESLIGVSVAKNLGLTKQRISQLRKEVALIFNPTDCENKI